MKEKYLFDDLLKELEEENPTFKKLHHEYKIARSICLDAFKDVVNLIGQERTAEFIDYIVEETLKVGRWDEKGIRKRYR